MIRGNSSKPHNPDRQINARETLQKANYTVENFITNYTLENFITNYTVENFINMIDTTTPLKIKQQLQQTVQIFTILINKTLKYQQQGTAKTSEHLNPNRENRTRET